MIESLQAPVTQEMGEHMLNGVHDLQITLQDVSSLASLTLYAEDWAGHGRLFPMGRVSQP